MTAYENCTITVSSHHTSAIKQGIKDMLNELVSEDLTESKRKEILEKYSWLNNLIIK